MYAARRRKLKRFVLDTNIWISYAINGELELTSDHKGTLVKITIPLTTK